MIPFATAAPPTVIAGYVRVSTAEQAEHGYSLDSQELAIRSYCDANNRVVYKIYCDRGITGTSVTKRHALQQMMEDAKAGHFSEVIVWKVNRLARRNLDFLNIVEYLSDHNIDLCSITENLMDTRTNLGKLNLQLMGAFSEFDRNNILENAQVGLRHRARIGLHNTRAPLGYRVVILSHSGRKRVTKLEVVPEEAAIVRRIFTQFASGRGLRAIANSLNQDGFRTKKSNPFSICAIRDILDNGFYAGKVTYLKYLDWGKKRRKGKNADPIVADGQHEPIITEELWEKVQLLRKQKSFVSEKRFHGELLLTGLLRCPSCGAAMTGSRTNNKDKHGNPVVRFYYSCSTMRNKGAVVCKANSIRKQDAEDYLFARLSEVLTKPHILRGIVKGINDRKTGGIKPLKDELSAVKAKTAEIHARRSRLMELYEMDDFDRALVADRIKQMDSDLDQLCFREAEIEQTLGAGNAEPLSFETVRSLIERFEYLLRQANTDQRKTLLHLIISKITVTPDKKIDKIELIFDEMTEQHFLNAAPSAANAVEGAFSFDEKAYKLENKISINI